MIKSLLVPRPTTEVARRTGTSPGTVSEHLSRLRSAGLVEPHRRGHGLFYRLSYEGGVLLALYGEAD